ncbi:MAG: HAD family hydrolase [Sphingomonadales bacterium]|nr:HAD family hydrolase [Sphingomonadales bacterium]
MNKALFLDRDGIINRDDGYVHRVQDLVWMPGIFELCRAARVAGYRLIVVTNQSGIGRGLFSESDYQRVQAFIHQHFLDENAPISHTYYCGDAPQLDAEGQTVDSLRRKPNPGMILEALSDYEIAPSASIMLGDSERDMAAARAAGIATRLLLFTSEGLNTTSIPRPSKGSHTHIIESLFSVMDFLI